MLDVTAATLYENVAQALAAARSHDWVEEIGCGLTTVTVKVRNPMCSSSLFTIPRGRKNDTAGGIFCLLRSKIRLISHESSVGFRQFSQSATGERWT